MNFICDKDNLLDAVSTVNNAISIKTALQILSNILIETKDNKIAITGTDMDICIRKEYEGDTKAEGNITVNAKKFMEILKTFPAGTIQFSVNKDNIIQINLIELKFGNNIESDFKIHGCSSNEYPKTDSTDNIENIKSKFYVKQSTLKNMIKKTIHSASREHYRYFLQGISFEKEADSNELKLIATDGKRLSLIKDEVESFTKYPDKLGIMVPLKPLNELSRVLKDEGNCEVTVTVNKVFFKLDDFNPVEISTNLIETDFPSYENIIPKEFKGTIKINSKVITDSTKRVSSILDIHDYKIKFEIRKDNITMYTNNPSIGEVKEKINMVTCPEVEIDIGLNYSFIIDTLKVIDTENITINFGDTMVPIIIKEEDNDDFFSMIGPMRLED